MKSEKAIDHIDHFSVSLNGLSRMNLTYDFSWVATVPASRNAPGLLAVPTAQTVKRPYSVPCSFPPQLTIYHVVPIIDVLRSLPKYFDETRTRDRECPNDEKSRKKFLGFLANFAARGRWSLGLFQVLPIFGAPSRQNREW